MSDSREGIRDEGIREFVIRIAGGATQDDVKRAARDGSLPQSR